MPEMAIRREVPDPRRRSVLGLARRCEWNRTHSEQVTRLTLEIFDDLKGLHGMGAEERELIEFCNSEQFSLAELAERLQRSSACCDLPWKPT